MNPVQVDRNSTPYLMTAGLDFCDRPGSPECRPVQSSSDASHSTGAGSSPTTVTNDGDRPSAPSKPKRSLSAYNFFFQAQRQEILESTPTRAEGKPRRSHGKIGFAELARLIASRWKTISDERRAEFEQMAAGDKSRYMREIEEWKRHEKAMTKGSSGPRGIYIADAIRNCSSAVPNLILTTKTPATPSSSASHSFREVATSFLDQPPHAPLVEPSFVKWDGPYIADLAEKLDSESLEMLVSMFRS